MFLDTKKISEIDKADIDRLVENETAESVRLDYKRDWKLSNREDKKEFLYDISAFANTEGGYLIYGIEEQKDENNKNTGIPERIVPVKNITNVDQFTQQIESLVQDGLSPSITRLGIQSIPYDDGIVLVIKIPKNYSMPIMVRLSNSQKFYRRRNSGKYQLDVFELRDAFLNSENMSKKFDEFHLERLRMYEAGEIFSEIDKEKILLFSVFPLSSRGNPLVFDDTKILNQVGHNMRSYESQNSSISFDYNIDGYMTACPGSGHISGSTASSQLFRNGNLEFYASCMYGEYHQTNNYVDCIYGFELEDAINHFIFQTLLVYKYLNIDLSFYGKLSLTGTLELPIIDETAPIHRASKLNREQISLPGMLFTEENKDSQADIMKTILWQGSGFAKRPKRR